MRGNQERQRGRDTRRAAELPRESLDPARTSLSRNVRAARPARFGASTAGSPMCTRASSMASRASSPTPSLPDSDDDWHPSSQISNSRPQHEPRDPYWSTIKYRRTLKDLKKRLASSPSPPPGPVYYTINGAHCFTDEDESFLYAFARWAVGHIPQISKTGIARLMSVRVRCALISH